MFTSFQMEFRYLHVKHKGLFINSLMFIDFFFFFQMQWIKVNFLKNFLGLTA